MFPQFKRLNNESGVILFIVLMTSIVIMLYSVGILTQSVNEIYYAQQQIDQITAGQLSSGIFWNSYASGMNSYSSAAESAGSGTGISYQEKVTSATSYIPAVNAYSVVTNFDTFN